MGAGKGAQPAADGVKQHVAAHQPAVRLRVGTEDHALVQHVDRLARQIQQRCPPPAKPGRCRANRAAARPASTTADTRRWPPAPARDPPDARRAPPPARPPRRPGRTPHRGMGEVERRLAQRQHQRTPKEAESAEHQQRQHAANLQRVRSCSSRVSIERSSAR